MIEVMLVVVIMLLVTLVVAPSMVRSFRGARLRTSARLVVMAHRHARSMAVLEQKQMALLFDKEKNELEIVSIASGDVGGRDMFFENRAARLSTPEEGTDGAPASSVSSEMIRPLEPNIRITEFKAEKATQAFEGIYWVNYYPNGMCDAYAVTLTDEHNRTLRVEVNAFSGNVTVEKPL